MSKHLIQSDILLMRNRYDEALSMQGIPALYQYPILNTTNEQGEPVVDHYSIEENVFIFFDSMPKIKTYKRLGWVVANDEDLPFLIHCSFNLKHLQRDCIFRFSGQYTGMDDKIFRVTQLTTDMQCPDHVTCQVIPVYDKVTLQGRTKQQVKNTYNSSSHFINRNLDYRGKEITTKDGDLQ